MNAFFKKALPACAFALCVSGAHAQSNDANMPQQEPMQQNGMARTQSDMSMSGVMGKHDMPATVTSVDKTTGMIRVESEGKQLRLHFPPSALTNVKQGDTITLHLSFSKK